MTIIYKWAVDEDEGYATKQAFRNEKCALSGRPVEPPFLHWISDESFCINVASLTEVNPVGLLRDLIELLHTAQDMKRRADWAARNGTRATSQTHPAFTAKGPLPEREVDRIIKWSVHAYKTGEYVGEEK